MKVVLQKNNILKTVPLGFFWTTLFFSIIVPLVRGDLKWAVIMTILLVITGGISNIIFPFIYNKIYIKSLIENGWIPSSENDKKILLNYNLIQK